MCVVLNNGSKNCPILAHISVNSKYTRQSGTWMELQKRVTMNCLIHLGTNWKKMHIVWHECLNIDTCGILGDEDERDKDER